MSGHDAQRWWQGVDLAPGKVAALRVLALTPDERQHLLGAFLHYTGADRMPTVPVLPARPQLGLQESYPIDLERIRALLTLIDRTDVTDHLHIPATAADQQVFTNLDRELAEQVVAYERRGPDQAAQVQTLLREIYHYLRGSSQADTLPLYEEGVTGVDVIIVPGCRGKGMILRAHQALHVLGTSPTPARVVLSGLHPYYARQFDFDAGPGPDGAEPVPFGEADAMATVIEDLAPELIDARYQPVGGTPLRQLVIDSRARNTLESIVHCLPLLQETYMALGRRLNICLVTSPYHVRRFHAITTVRLRHLVYVGHLVDTVVCSPARSGVDMPQLQDITDPRHTYAVGLYLRECLKLLGGRIVGEF